MSRQTGGQTLTAVIVPKQENMQYLTVDNATYVHWRTLALSLCLSSDGEMASFLLQHFEKTSNLQLTQCVRCGGSVVQYCVPCNIYMTHPTTPSLPRSLLPQDSAAVSACDTTTLSSDTILLNLRPMENEQLLLQDIAVKADGRTDNSGCRQTREVRASPSTSSGGRREGQKVGTPPSKLRMLVETTSKKGLEPSAIKLAVPKPQTAARSLLTPNVLRNLKSRAQQNSAETVVPTEVCATVTGPAGNGDSTQPSTSTDSQAARMSQVTVQSLTSGQPSQLDRLSAAVTAEPSSVTRTAQKEAQREIERSLSHSAKLQKFTGFLQHGHSSLNMVEPSSSSSTSEKDAECLASMATPQKKTDSDDQVQLIIVELLPSAENSQQRPEQSLSISAEEEMLACESSFTVTLKETTDPLPGTQPPVNLAETMNSTQHGAECPSPASAVQTQLQPLPPADQQWAEPGSSVQSDSSPQQDGDASSGPELTPDLAVGEQSEARTHSQTKEDAQNQPVSRTKESSKSKTAESVMSKRDEMARRDFFYLENMTFAEDSDEDSDYHCEPLFTTQQQHDGGQAKHTAASSHSASPHTADFSRTESAGLKTLSQKRRISHTNTMEIVDRDRVQDADVAKKRKTSDGQVIIFTDQDYGSPQPLPSTQEESDGEPPVCRPKRTAASKASWTWRPVKVKTEVMDDDHQVMDTRGQVRDIGDLIGTVSDQVGGDNVDDNTSQACATVSEAGVRVKDSPDKVEDCKVSVLLELDLQKRAAILALKKKRLEDQRNNDDIDMILMLRRQRNRKPCPCPFCEEVFRTGLDRLKHVTEKHGKRPYVCTQCNTAYTKLAYLNAHINYHHAGVKSNVCSMCGRSFVRAGQLKIHQKNCKDRMATCKVCGITLKCARFLKHHMRTHNQVDKPYICQVCGRAFRWRSNLSDHLRVHNNDKRFVCSVCGHKFVQSGSLRQHMERRHSDQPRPYICEVCGDVLCGSYVLEKHKMIHTGEKPCVCKVCGAAFIETSALSGHMKIHTDQEGKPHKCPVCGAAFKILSSVTKHMNKVHKAKTVDQKLEEIVAEEIVAEEIVAEEIVEQQQETDSSEFG